jgi:hypothetical protein
MSHIHSSGETRLAPPFVTHSATPTAARRQSHPSLGIDRQHLRAVIADRRAALSAIEMEMVGRCEEAAARPAPRHVRLDDRSTWDRSMWDRYLSTAAALEPDYMPQMLRLHAEIERLERISLLPAAPEARAA